MQLTPKDFYLPLSLCGAPFDYETYAETAGFELNTNKNVPFGLSIFDKQEQTMFPDDV